eukprot:9769660-Ditylum_brightwellii.AAC.1
MGNNEYNVFDEDTVVFDTQSTSDNENNVWDLETVEDNNNEADDEDDEADEKDGVNWWENISWNLWDMYWFLFYHFGEAWADPSA